MKVYVAKYKLNDKIFYTSRIDEKDTYGVFYLLTQQGEVGIIDCINDKPAALDDIEQALKENTRFAALAGHRKNDYLQDAWRFFADTSAGGEIWYLGHIYGVPEIGGAFTAENRKLLTKLDSYQKEEEVQKVQFTKWLSLSRSEKTEMIDLFMQNPVQQSYPILHDFFHDTKNNTYR